MFEAVHGSAPDIAGKDIANPSGLLVAATQMLVHLGQPEVAERIKNAWLATIEAGIHTADLYDPAITTRKVGTAAFGQAVAQRLGDAPKTLEPVSYQHASLDVPVRARPRRRKSLVGVDVFVDGTDADRRPDALGEGLASACGDGWKLKMITNRGVKVYPDGLPETFCTDHWRCRFLPASGPTTNAELVRLLGRLTEAGYDVIKTENLYEFDGERAYSLGQGE